MDTQKTRDMEMDEFYYLNNLTLGLRSEKNFLL